MTLITVHLHNFEGQELDINSDHIVSIESANVGANIQMVSGPTIHTAETRAELNQLINGGSYAPVIETKSVEGDPSTGEVVETAAQRKTRLKAEAEAAAAAQQ